METVFDLRVYFAVVRRRLLYVIVPAVLIGLGGVALAYLLPPTYESSATILVQSQLIPTDLAASTVTASADERIQVIEQRLLARDNLLQIAGKFDLYAYQGADLTPTIIVDTMRAAISIQQIDASKPASSRSGAQVIGFTVKFAYRIPTIAARVTSELVSSILSQNIESRMSRASETSKFLEQQKDALEAQLLALENRLADFKRVNEGDLPETLVLRREQLGQLMTQLDDISQRIRLGATDGLTADASTMRQLSFNLKAKQLELDSVRSERDRLAPLLEEGVITANQMRELEQKVAIVELNIEALKAEIEARGGAVSNEGVLALLQSQQEELTSRIAALNASISRTPAIEVELSKLNRDYENLLTEYRQAQARLVDAQTGEQLEQDRQAETFDVIEQPTVSDTPTEPNRPRIMLMAGFGGLALGIGLAVLLEMLDKRLYSSLDLERRLRLRPIATIPFVETRWEIRRRQLKLVATVVVGISAGIALLVVIDTYYLPLDLLAQRALQRVGVWLPGSAPNSLIILE